MLIDARRIERAAVVRTQVAIVGGGPAGLTLALALESAGISVIVLESGPLVPDARTLKLYQGDNVGLPYEFAQGYRNRYLGGNSNCWGGFCRPWDAWEFDRRPWVPDSGWPIGAEELSPYYDRVATLLRLGATDYEADSWVRHLARDDVSQLSADPSEFRDGVSLLSPPVRFGVDYREHLTRSSLISLYLWANVVDIETDRPVSGVRSLQVRTLSGNQFKVQADQFVLASGGIENARLLLASNRVEPAGLGNGNDVVGRYFADHPRVRWGKLKLAPGERSNRLYDITFNFLAGSVGDGKARLSGFMALPYEVQQREGLVNAHVWLRSMFLGEESDLRMSLARMKQRLLVGQRYGFGLARDAYTLVRHPLSTAAFTASYIARSRALMREICLEGIAEAAPNRDSRVSLSEQRDALGMPRTRVDWRLSEQTARTFDRTFERLADVLEKAGAATVERSPSIVEHGWPDSMESTWHPMGTTRMHDSPRQGVVDRHCRVHGIANLYVAGSSVFATTGANHPTMTLLALSLRLVDRLVQRDHGRLQTQTVASGADIS